jgi:hypothetical protein
VPQGVDILAPSLQAAPSILPIFDGPQPYEGPTYSACSAANLIPDKKSIANVFFVLELLQIESVGWYTMTLLAIFHSCQLMAVFVFCDVPLQCNLGEADL